MEIGEALPAHVREKVTAAIGKHFEGGGDASVTFEREGNELRSDFLLHLNSGVSLHSHGTGSDPQMAFDMALERMEKQVRRYARRLKNHHGRPVPDSGRS